MPAGKRYNESGAVEFTPATDRRLEALVFGSDDYEVQLDWDPDGMLSANCTCPYYGEGQRPCKHLWAALRAAQNGAHSRTARRPAQARPESAGHWSLRLPRLVKLDASQALERAAGSPQQAPQVPEWFGRLRSPEGLARTASRHG